MLGGPFAFLARAREVDPAWRVLVSALRVLHNAAEEHRTLAAAQSQAAGGPALGLLGPAPPRAAVMLVLQGRFSRRLSVASPCWLLCDPGDVAGPPG